jgi:hypothetical protein
MPARRYTWLWQRCAAEKRERHVTHSNALVSLSGHTVVVGAVALCALRDVPYTGGIGGGES